MQHRKALDPHLGPATIDQVKKHNTQMKKGKPTSADLLNTALSEIGTSKSKDYIQKGDTESIAKTIPDLPKKQDSKPPTSNSSLPIPLQDRILVSKKKPESKTAGGIIIPEMFISKENEGVVVAVGPIVGSKVIEALKNDQVDFTAYPKVGDKIFFGEFAGIELEYNGEKYLIMRENDIICILP